MLDEISLEANDEMPSGSKSQHQSQSSDGGQISLSKKELQTMIEKAVSEALDDQGDEQPDEADDDSREVDDELLDAIISTNENISPALATTIERRLTERMNYEVMSKKRELYKAVPGNLAESLMGTSMNPELWSSMPSYGKTKDKKYV